VKIVVNKIELTIFELFKANQSKNIHDPLIDTKKEFFGIENLFSIK